MDQHEVYTGLVYRLQLADATREGWKIEDLRWYDDSQCRNQIEPFQVIFTNLERDERYGRRQAVKSLPYKAPCDDDAAFDPCGCRVPYAGWNYTAKACQDGEPTTARDEYYCAENPVTITTKFGCPKDVTSIEAWFMDTSTPVECVRIKQSITASYRAKDVRVQKWNALDNAFESVFPGGDKQTITNLGGRDTNKNINDFFLTEEYINGLTISFKKACPSRFTVPDVVAVDIDVDHEKAHLSLRNDAREVRFNYEPAHGTAFTLHCIGDPGALVAEVKCENGAWDSGYTSARGCMTSKYVPPHAREEIQQKTVTATPDEPGVEIATILGIFAAVMGALILLSFGWQWLRKSASDRKHRVQASSPGSNDALRGNRYSPSKYSQKVWSDSVRKSKDDKSRRRSGSRLERMEEELHQNALKQRKSDFLNFSHEGSVSSPSRPRSEFINKNTDHSTYDMGMSPQKYKHEPASSSYMRDPPMRRSSSSSSTSGVRKNSGTSSAGNSRPTSAALASLRKETADLLGNTTMGGGNTSSGSGGTANGKMNKSFTKQGPDILAGGFIPPAQPTIAGAPVGKPTTIHDKPIRHQNRGRKSDFSYRDSSSSMQKANYPISSATAARGGAQGNSSSKNKEGIHRAAGKRSYSPSFVNGTNQVQGGPVVADSTARSSFGFNFLSSNKPVEVNNNGGGGTRSTRGNDLFGNNREATYLGKR